MDRRRRALLGAAAALSLSNAFALERRVTRKIPSTGEALPAIGVGTWQTFDVGADAAEQSEPAPEAPPSGTRRMSRPRKAEPAPEPAPASSPPSG